MRTILRVPFGSHQNQRGSVAVEYLVVSGFTLVLSIAAVTWMGSVVRDRMTKIADKIHAPDADLDLDIGLGDE